ncbi:MAG: 5-formyltetrahydrofolate cyclo-ligase [Actinomycetota bacterium]
MQVRERKDTVRRLTLARRGRLDAAEREARAERLIERLLAMPEVAEAERVLAFVSVRSEVPTGRLLQAVLASGSVLLLPYVADDGALQAAEVESLDELEPGYRGIPEPRSRFALHPAEASVIVLPGVAFDERGRRLGHGGGFYDAFLRESPVVPRIGICFEVQVVPEVPVEPHDERVDAVVTENRVIRCARA